MSPSENQPSRRWPYVTGAAILLVALGAWWWNSSRSDAAANAAKSAVAPVSVTTAVVREQALPVVLVANGSVVALQSVEVRPQVSSTIAAIHIAEGQTVKQGDLLFTLDARTEEANLRKAEAQVVKSRSDYANAERNLKRQRELFDQKFISQAALDTAVTQTDVLKGQLAVDEAASDAARVARSLTQIRAPFSGRTGAIAVRVGSLVQPTGAALVVISQVDPIGVSFAVPERELPYLQAALAKGELPVSLEVGTTPKRTMAGKLVFIESTVDSASGTIAMKASFANAERLLWPGMFVNVSMSPRVLPNALVVPVQAVQSGPDRKFVYTIADGNKAVMKPVEVELTQSGLAAIKGVLAGTRVVVEGAQNVRNNGTVAEGAPGKTPSPAKAVDPAAAASGKAVP